MSYVAGLVLALAIVANMEWRTDEDLVTMAILLAAGIGLGWLRPRLFLLSGLLLGLVVPALNLLTLVTGIRPSYETAVQASSHQAAYVLGLLVLIVPAVIAALIGKFIGQRV